VLDGGGIGAGMGAGIGADMGADDAGGSELAAGAACAWWCTTW
jgi:hypothetical protein